MYIFFNICLFFHCEITVLHLLCFFPNQIFGQPKFFTPLCLLLCEPQLPQIEVVWVIHCIFHPHNQSFSYYEFHSIFCILFQFHYSILVIFQIFFVHLKYFLGQIMHCLQENQFTTHANKSTRLIPRRSKSCSCRIINIRRKKEDNRKTIIFSYSSRRKEILLRCLIFPSLRPRI